MLKLMKFLALFLYNSYQHHWVSEGLVSVHFILTRRTSAFTPILCKVRSTADPSNPTHVPTRRGQNFTIHSLFSYMYFSIDNEAMTT